MRRAEAAGVVSAATTSRRVRFPARRSRANLWRTMRLGARAARIPDAARRSARGRRGRRRLRGARECVARASAVRRVCYAPRAMLADESARPAPPGPPNRRIAHVDMDAFYASVEIRDDPSLAGKPVVVGGAADQRGVVAAASYAARRFGIRSAMPMAQALRRCPDLVRLPGDPAKYAEVSRRVFEVLATFSPTLETLSLDEAFLDVTGTERHFGPSPRLGRLIKDAIHEAVALTASVGIAPIKFAAKLASDHGKPDGLVVVEPDGLTAFLEPLPIERLWGVGAKTASRLHALGILTM